MNIPNKLQKDGFRFIKLNGKIPIEKDWQNTANYSYKKFNHKFNYGVATGYGGLVVIDWDNKEFYEKLKDQFPETFTVQTGSGGIHNYFLTDDPQSFKILDENQVTLADIQGKGKQVVGAGSIHPEAQKPYIVLKDIDLAVLQKEKLDKIFEHTKKALKNSEHTVYDFSLIEFDRIKKYLKFKENKVNCLWHKEKDPSLTFYLDTGQYHCFGCGKHGKISEFISEYIKNYLDDKQEYLFEAFNNFTNYLSQATNFLKKQPIYYDINRVWWLWNAKEYRWKRTDETNILNAIDKYTKNPSVNSKVKNEILEALKRKGRLLEPKEVKETWIQFKDKIIDIETDEEFQATPEYFVTNPINWELGDSDDTPTIDKLFFDWVGEEHRGELYEVLAFCMLPKYFIHRIICLIGSGANGKSTFLKLLYKIICDYNISTTSLEGITKSRFESVKLYKKLVALMGETNFTTLSKTDLLKRLTGEDLVGGEIKNKDPFDFTNYAKIIIATNSLPITFDKTFGFYRRWKIIEFNNKFEKEVDILKDIPEEEYNNLANKCLKILKGLWYCRIFENDGTFEERKQRYEEKSNPLIPFIKDNYIEDINQETPFYQFFNDYNTYLIDNGFRETTKNSLSKLLTDRGFEMKRMNIVKNDGSKQKMSYILGLSSPQSPNSPHTSTQIHIGGSNRNMGTIGTLESTQENQQIIEEEHVK